MILKALLQLSARVSGMHNNLLFLAFAMLTFTASTIEGADCTTGAVKLVNFTDDPLSAIREGTMQICINDAWGTVCGDRFLDIIDAEVFCHQLEGFHRDS